MPLNKIHEIGLSLSKLWVHSLFETLVSLSNSLYV